VLHCVIEQLIVFLFENEPAFGLRFEVNRKIGLKIGLAPQGLNRLNV